MSRYQHCMFQTVVLTVTIDSLPPVTYPCKKADIVQASGGVNKYQYFAGTVYINKWRVAPEIQGAGNAEIRDLCAQQHWTNYVHSSGTAPSATGYWFSFAENQVVTQRLQFAPPNPAGDDQVVTNEFHLTTGSEPGVYTFSYPPLKYRCDRSLATNHTFSSGAEACMFPDPIPELGFSYNDLPGITDNISNAFQRGAPSTLTRLWRGTAAYNKNVRQKNASCSLLPQPTPEDGEMSCDEYPFATTGQGLAFGPGAVAYVPADQQDRQGGQISGFYNAQRLLGGDDETGGDQFRVYIYGSSNT